MTNADVVAQSSISAGFSLENMTTLLRKGFSGYFDRKTKQMNDWLRLSQKNAIAIVEEKKKHGWRQSNPNESNEGYVRKTRAESKVLF